MKEEKVYKNFIEKATPKNKEYQVWLTDQIEPTIDLGLPPWADPNNELCFAKYNFNNVGLRCDDFKENMNIDVLYAGCEDTFGYNFNIEDTWPFFLNKKLKNNNFLTITYPSGGNQKLINNLFKFFINYGNPKNLYLMMPSLISNIGVIPEDGVFKPKIYRQHVDESLKEHNLMAVPHDVPLTLLSLNFLERIRYLEQYCYSTGINLKWSCSDFFTNEFLKQYNFRFKFEIDNDIQEISYFHQIIYKSFLKQIEMEK